MTRKQLGAIVSGEGKAPDKAEFKVDYNKSLGPWASASPSPSCKRQLRPRQASPGSGLNLAVIITLLTSGAEPQSLQKATAFVHTLKTHHLQTC